MTPTHIMRNVITLLFVLTLANLAASFSALHAVHVMRDDTQAQIRHVDAAVVSLATVTQRLCADRGVVCGTVQVSTAK